MLGNIGFAILLLFTLTRSNITQYMTVRLYREKVKRIQCQTNEIIDFKENIDWCRESRNVCRISYQNNNTCVRSWFSKTAKVNCTNGNDCQIQQQKYKSFCDREYLRVQYICKKRAPAQTLQPTISTTVKTVFKTEKNGNVSLIPKTDVIQLEGNATTETSTSKKENTGKIIATTISILVLLTTIVGLVFAYRKWKKRKKLAANDAPPRYVNADVVVPMKQKGDVVASAKSTETDSNESIYCSTVENSRQPVQSQPSKRYAELGPGGGLIGGNEKVKTEQHYREVKNDHEYDDVRRK